MSLQSFTPCGDGPTGKKQQEKAQATSGLGGQSSGVAPLSAPDVSSEAACPPSLDESRRWWILVLVGVLLVGLALRIGWASLYPQAYLGGDVGEYARLARNLVEHGVFGRGAKPESLWPPGNPAFLAALSYLFGNNVGAFFPTFGPLFALVTLVLTYALGRELGLGRLAASIPVFLLAIYPCWLFVNTIPLSENLYGVLFLTWTLLILRSIRTKRPEWMILSGVVWAAANLTRPILYVLLFLTLAIGVVRRNWFGIKRRWVLSSTLLALALTSLWTVRNYCAFGMFIPVNTLSGYNFYFGNNANPDPGWLGQGHPLFEPLLSLNAEQAYSKSISMALEYIVRHPDVTLLRIPWKTVKLFRPELYGLDLNTSHQLHMHQYVFHGISGLIWYILLIGAVGFFVQRPYRNGSRDRRVNGGSGLQAGSTGNSAHQDLTRRRQFAFIALLLAYYIGIHWMFFTVARFRYPIEPVCAVLSVFFLQANVGRSLDEADSIGTEPCQG